MLRMGELAENPEDSFTHEYVMIHHINKIKTKLKMTISPPESIRSIT
jgi:hypothetical protein